MKRSMVKKCSLICLAVAFVAMNADAQRTSKKRNQQNNNPQNQNRSNKVTTIMLSHQAITPMAIFLSRVDTSSVIDNTVKKSLRNDNAFDKTGVMERNPLPYENLRWDDALFSEKVWREIDLREKINQVFRYEAQDDNGSQIFVDMLLKAVNSGEVTAFSDDRFTTPMSLNEISDLTVGAADTVAKTDINDPSKVVEYVVTKSSFDPKSVVKIRIKEEWVFDREASRMFVRILGIAPLKTLYLPNGQERGTTVMFWVLLS